ncbi:hypothetical protein B5K03_33670 [Rhizobium phaseoli]|uniref:hypothetical protein n=1 Tax=Rhizobium phaseoli TaxID=396 RepID=UPI000D67C922|nr:hypothetical protein [Rhizobium phaseoli]PWI49891.1 hypothetical protein B5K03_33670 [Rhizobium phaseoli]
MDRLLIAFIRQRMPDGIDVDLGEFFDVTERYFKEYFNTKLEARPFFEALRAVQRERRRKTSLANRKHNGYSR